MISAASNALFPSMSEPPSSVKQVRRDFISLTLGSSFPSMARIIVMTASVALPMSSSFPSELRDSDLSMPDTLLKVSRSILARSCKENCPKSDSPSSSSLVTFVSSDAETQSLSFRSSASATSETRSASPSSVSVSASSAILLIVPRREEGPRVSQCTATWSLTTLISGPANASKSPIVTGVRGERRKEAALLVAEVAGRSASPQQAACAGAHADSPVGLGRKAAADLTARKQQRRGR
mmetsp:Transcript_753/g.2248  ORF Transcript_753/g.2248 Transcript_753/m.2248 type:complete len:238 (+) Transcript_753:2218-2931(+)